MNIHKYTFIMEFFKEKKTSGTRAVRFGWGVDGDGCDSCEGYFQNN